MPVRPLALLLLVAAAGCNGPFAVFPGGRLEGEVRPVPADWTFAGTHGTAQIETRPGDPYSVNLAYTIVRGTLYVNAGDTETRWVRNMSADPRVRLRIDGALYELRAERVTGADEVAAFAEAWTGQSMLRRDPTELEEVWIYRLVGR